MSIRKGDHNSFGRTIDIVGEVRRKIGVELEINFLNKRKRKTAGHWRKLNVDKHVSDGSADISRWHVLIDYRNGNRRLLKRAFTRLEVWRKNQMLAGSGKAWAMVTP